MSKVLIADDDRVSCKLLAGLLTKWGYEADIVYNGVDAQCELGGNPLRSSLGLWQSAAVSYRSAGRRGLRLGERGADLLSPLQIAPLFELRLSRQRTVAA